MSVSIDSTVVAAKDLLSTDLEGELVVLSTTRNLYYGLNELGRRIWQLIQDPRRVKDIRNSLVDEYEVATDQLERDVIALLQDLVDEGLAKVNEG